MHDFLFIFDSFILAALILATILLAAHWLGRGQVDNAEGLEVPCLECGARVAERCTSMDGMSHEERRMAANDGKVLCDLPSYV